MKKDKTIRFDTKIEWHEKQTLLKTVFETDIRSTFATYDIQYGNITRPTHRNTSWDLAKFEVPAHYYSDLSNNTYGIALINDCKYGYSTFGANMSLTLIKSGIYPDPHADLGNHEFSYCLFPHKNSLLDSNVSMVIS